MILPTKNTNYVGSLCPLSCKLCAFLYDFSSKATLGCAEALCDVERQASVAVQALGRPGPDSTDVETIVKDTPGALRQKHRCHVSETDRTAVAHAQPLTTRR